MKQIVILDTGPLVAYFRKSDQFHQWAITQWSQVNLPVLTCDTVISEACFLLRDSPNVQRAILELIESKAITIDFNPHSAAQSRKKDSSFVLLFSPQVYC
jgi:predicted nucleic acid-binding protein